MLARNESVGEPKSQLGDLWVPLGEASERAGRVWPVERQRGRVEVARLATSNCAPLSLSFQPALVCYLKRFTLLLFLTLCSSFRSPALVPSCAVRAAPEDQLIFPAH